MKLAILISSLLISGAVLAASATATTTTVTETSKVATVAKVKPTKHFHHVIVTHKKHVVGLHKKHRQCKAIEPIKKTKVTETKTTETKATETKPAIKSAVKAKGLEVE